jgi:hypothetical protein
MKYKLTYARTVIFERIIEADSVSDADGKAIDLELNDELGFRWLESEPGTLIAQDGSSIRDIVDDETIWEIEEAV